MQLESIASQAEAASKRISPYIRQTPLEHSAYFSEKVGANVWLKLENLQITGSFKLRGACNKLLSLPKEQVDAGCVAASSGNHGAAVAHAARSPTRPRPWAARGWPASGSATRAAHAVRGRCDRRKARAPGVAMVRC